MYWYIYCTAVSSRVQRSSFSPKRYEWHIWLTNDLPVYCTYILYYKISFFPISATDKHVWQPSINSTWCYQRSHIMGTRLYWSMYSSIIPSTNYRQKLESWITNQHLWKVRQYIICCFSDMNTAPRRKSKTWLAPMEDN